MTTIAEASTAGRDAARLAVGDTGRERGSGPAASQHLRNRRLKAAALGVSLACLLASPAFAGPVEDIKALLENGQAAAAYELGTKHPELLGDPAFDFYFGVAAIGAGRAGEGVLALERYVVTAPDNVNGRLELGRGYFVLGEDSRAREEFDLVLKSNPPIEVQANVQRFLDAIRAREFMYRPTAGYYLEAGVGYDTNANGGIVGDNIVRWGLGLAVAPAGQQQADSFLTVAGGFNWSRPIEPGFFGFASAGFTALHYNSQDQVDQLSGRADGGLTWIRDKNLWRLTAGVVGMQLGGEAYRDAWSLSGEWQRQLDEFRNFNVFAQIAELNYSGDNRVRDSTFGTLGAGYRHALVSARQPLLGASAYVAREDVHDPVRSDLSRDIYGARLSASLTPAPKWSAMAGVAYQHSRYDGGEPDPTGGPPEPRRKDDYTEADIGLSYALTRELTFKGELLVSRNSSNDALAAYKRNVLGLKIRYEVR